MDLQGPASQETRKTDGDTGTESRGELGQWEEPQCEKLYRHIGNKTALINTLKRY